MKRIMNLAVVAMILVFASCEKDDINEEERNDLSMEFSVESYS